jgi:hypothetical protein
MMTRRQANQHPIAAAALGDCACLPTGPDSRTPMPALPQR